MQVVVLALMLAVQPSRPFGTEPAWPAGDISAVLVPAPRSSAPAVPATQRSTRVRAPYRQAEEPASVDLDAVRRQQRERMRDPGGWRQGVLPSQGTVTRDPTSRFRETPLGPR